MLFVAACADQPSGPELDDQPEPFGTVRGQAFAPGRLTLNDVQARVRWGDQEATGPVALDGTFSVPLPDTVSGFGFLTLEPGPGSALLPSWVLLVRGDLDAPGKIVMMPRSWSIESGDYAGQTVSIRPSAAADARVMPSFWGTYFPFRQDGFLQVILDSSEWTGAFRTWSTDDFPIDVALDRPGSNAPFSAADSTLLWRHLDRMEQALGRDAFRPVRIEDVPVLGGSRRALGTILVQIDTAQEVRGEGVANVTEPWTWSLTADATSWSGGWVQQMGFLSARISSGQVRFHDASLMEDQQLVIHEMMHTLGAGHGCSWPSVQTYCASLLTDVPTAEDVAHLEVLEAIRHLEGELGTRWGVLASVIGHRVVTLGLPPVPAPDLVYGPSAVPSEPR